MSREDREHLAELIRVARWYYEDELSQAEIAGRVAYSRPTVSRMLSEARQRGIVKVVIEHPMEREVALERRLAEEFGCAARVTTAADGEPALTSVARVAGQLLVDACRDKSVLAVSAGSAVAAVVQEVPEASLRRLMVVQMIGSLSDDNPLVDSPEVTRGMAARLGASYRLLPAPLIVRTAQLSAALRREEPVATAIALASHADIALVGVGAVDATGKSGQIFQGWLTPSERRLVASLGAVGHISGHHFDAEGRHIRSEVCSRVMSADLDTLNAVGTVIGVASGLHKAVAIRGALRGGHLDMLVTDDRTAEAVLRP